MPSGNVLGGLAARPHHVVTARDENQAVSPEASTVLLAPLVLTVVFTIDACLAMWPKSTTVA
jgi:hypothetical protein